MRHALTIPPVGQLSDPHALVELAVAAEARGWDGFFLWDHLQRPEGEPAALADPWVALAAIAGNTTRMRLGPLVTPVARRRPLKLAHETATLDQLSRGRVTLGVGLGVDAGGEFSRTGEETDPRARAAMLDEGVSLLDHLLRGERIVHRGQYFTLDGITLSPTGVQRPRVPMWLAARGHSLAPVRRAARFDGVALLAMAPQRLAEIVECVRNERGSLNGFDVAVLASNDYPLAAYESEGATWSVHCPFEAKTLTTEARTSSVYDMREDDAFEHVMGFIDHRP